MDLPCYEGIKTLYPEAYHFICTRLFKETLADGRYELDNGIYVNIETYRTKFRKDCRFESHKKYTDIQILLDGRELVSVAPVEELSAIVPYDEEKDIVFYQNEPKGVDYLLEAGNYLVFSPEQAHMPCICVNESAEVHKAVIKVPVA